MILLVLMSFILIAGYVFAMIKKMKEIPYSISDTYYAMMHKVWFTLSKFQNRTKSCSLYRCRHVFNFFPDMGRLQ